MADAVQLVHLEQENLMAVLIVKVYDMHIAGHSYPTNVHLICSTHDGCASSRQTFHMIISTGYDKLCRAEVRPVELAVAKELEVDLCNMMRARADGAGDISQVHNPHDEA